MYLLIPGRHHVLTRFQEQYLFRFLARGLDGECDTSGLALSGAVDGVIFAVTSADHSATRRNPLPFFLRAMAIHELGSRLDGEVLVFGIPEAGQRPDFAAYTVKTIAHESGGVLNLRPDNTVVVCATAVAAMYEQLGYRVWAGERERGASLPWDLVEAIARGDQADLDPTVLEAIHPASWRIIKRYGQVDRFRRLFAYPLVGSDGDLTTTRDYRTYTLQMDQNMALKWEETREAVRPGRIGDIGCAVGSWLLRASQEPRLANSDFYGIELTRALYDICLQRRHNGEFPTPNVWFAQRNAVEGQVFQPGSMDTIHSSSLTHEIESYGSREDLLAFIRWRYSELVEGGIWINRDVVGPEDGDRQIVLELCASDGGNDEGSDPRSTLPANCSPEKRRQLVASWLAGLSTAARFRVFARDFRRDQSGSIAYTHLPAAAGSREGWERVQTSLRSAAEFLLTKDYTDNWESEMHETFCHWSFSDWQKALETAGFTLAPASRAFVNPWILEQRWLGKVALSETDGRPCPWPPCTVLLFALKE